MSILWPKALLLAFTFALASPLASVAQDTSKRQPDVLFLVVDDLNNWISLLDSEAPIHTPNLERLANQGTLFTQAYTISPACNPSRVATWTGKRPSSSGVYGNRSDWRTAMPDRPTLMQRFRKAGYAVRGAGKIFHHHLNGAFHDPESFEEFQPMRAQSYPPEKLNRAPEYGSRNTDWGVWPPEEADAIDTATTEFGINALLRPDERPQFLALGFYKPHSPFFAPARFHKPYQEIGLPTRLPEDWDDIPAGAAKLLASKRWFWEGMTRLDRRIEGSYHDFVQSYAACVGFVDHCIGRVLNAWEKSPRRDQTIVVLWSDHGFHLGEKDHIEKFALWEKSTQVPFVIVAPGLTTARSVCHQPVDLSAIYPTLLELAGLPSDPKADGFSIAPLLRDPEAPWSRPALTTYQRGAHAVRSQRWRYIRYPDGSEELYDHDHDPHEWTNRAKEPGLDDVLNTHRAWLPTEEAIPVGDLLR